MTTTWSVLNSRLSYFLDDNPADGESAYQFPVPLRVMAWNYAQALFEAHTLRERSVDVTILEGGRSFTKPADLVEIGLLYDAGLQTIYAKRTFVEGGQRPLLAPGDYTYWLWGDTVWLDSILTEGDTLSLDYFASWPVVEAELADDVYVYRQSEVYVPTWAELPLLHLTAATCLMPSAVSAAMLNEFKSRPIDSGGPLDNPRELQARAHLWWYGQLLAMHHPQLRVVGLNG